MNNRDAVDTGLTLIVRKLKLGVTCKISGQMSAKVWREISQESPESMIPVANKLGIEDAIKVSVGMGGLAVF